jgi:hypothetical protein
MSRLEYPTTRAPFSKNIFIVVLLALTVLREPQSLRVVRGDGKGTLSSKRAPQDEEESNFPAKERKNTPRHTD